MPQDYIWRFQAILSRCRSVSKRLEDADGGREQDEAERACNEVRSHLKVATLNQLDALLDGDLKPKLRDSLRGRRDEIAEVLERPGWYKYDNLVTWSVLLDEIAGHLEFVVSRLKDAAKSAESKAPRKSSATTYQIGQVGVLSAGRGNSVTMGPVSVVSGSVPDPAKEVDEAQFRKDVVEILQALIDAKEQLEGDYKVLTQFFSSLLQIEVEGKTAEQVTREIQGHLKKSPQKTTRAALAKLSQQAEPVVQGIVANILYSGYVAPALAALGKIAG